MTQSAGGVRSVVQIFFVTEHSVETVQVALLLNTVITIAGSYWLALVQCKQR